MAYYLKFSNNEQIEVTNGLMELARFNKQKLIQSD